MQATIDAIYRYPIKGLSSEILQQVSLSTGQALPFDHYYALALHDTEFNPNNPQYLSKTHFLILMKNERLAALHTEFDVNTHIFNIRQQNKLLLRTNLQTLGEKSEF